LLEEICHIDRNSVNLAGIAALARWGIPWLLESKISLTKRITITYILWEILARSLPLSIAN